MEISEQFDKVKFDLQIIDGKIFAVPCPSDLMLNMEIVNGNVEVSLSEEKCSIDIFNILKPVIDNHHMSNPIINCNLPIKNPEKQHLTIINSNVVYDCGLDQVESFLKDHKSKNNSYFYVEFNGVKSTISNDWSLFSRCYVVGIKSTYIDDFVEKFNSHFNGIV
jgi:hypothetical protein